MPDGVQQGPIGSRTTWASRAVARAAEQHFEAVARAACLGERVVFGSLEFVAQVDEQLEDEVQRTGQACS